MIAALESKQRQQDEQPPPETPAVNVEPHSDVFDVPTKTETGELRDRRRKQAAVHIATTMESAYSLDDLRDLCFAFHIDYESIEGEGKREKIRAFVRHFHHRKTLRVLVEFLEGDRPNEVWRVKDIGD